MNCKKCNTDLADKECKTIAQWNFCLDCFNEIIRQGEEKSSAPQAPQQPAPKGDVRRCIICDKELGASEGLDLLGLLFCDRCYESIVNRPTEHDGRDDGIAGGDEPGKKRVAQVRVDFVSQAKCYQCGKTIRCVAGREHQGRLYCPDCYFNIPEIKNPPPQALMDASLPAGPPKEFIEKSEERGASVCQACQRLVLQENLKAIEGFELCLSCLAADSDTALEIARLRHRRRLKEIKKSLA